MDEDRIVQNFRNRMYAPNVQIKVLCELMGKTRRQILTILHNAGEALNFEVSPKKNTQTMIGKISSECDWMGIRFVKSQSKPAFRMVRLATGGKTQGGWELKSRPGG